MASKVELCNLALTRIGASRITTLGDTTVEAKDCNAIYDIIAKQTMSLGTWPSVVRRASLAQLSETPEYEFTYAYQLPTDPKCLRILSINEFKRGEIPFAIEGSTLLCDESTVKIKYLAYITDPESYDIYLEQAVVDRLTAELTYKMTGQTSAYRAALEYANGHARDLLAEAGIGSGSSMYVNSDTFLDARQGIFPDEGEDTD